MHGKLIVLDGIDGSGKSTQFSLLCQRLEAEGIDFRRAVFPRYDKPSASMIKAYLSGEFGSDPGDVSSYAASTFFFVDRYASYKTDWGQYYNNGGLILCDRYTTSNAIHQGAKLSGARLSDYLDWLYDFEFRLMELPSPDVVLYMDIDLETCLAQMKLRQERTNTTGDIHETHTEYLAACLTAGNTAAERFGWKKIKCLDNGAMRSIESIHDEIYGLVTEVL